MTGSNFDDLPPPYREALEKELRGTFFRYLSWLFLNRRTVITSWDGACNIIFGAMLSAYAGVKISNMEETPHSALIFFGICCCHAIFLWSVIFSRDIDHRPRKAKKFIFIFNIIIPLLCVIVAGILWDNLFGNVYFYTAIVGGWMICAVLFSAMFGSISGITEGNVARFEQSLFTELRTAAESIRIFDTNEAGQND